MSINYTSRLRRAFLLWRADEGYAALACPRQHIDNSYLGANTLATAVWVPVVINGLSDIVSGSGSGDHYLDWGAFSHRLFSQVPSKEKGEEKREHSTKQNRETKCNARHAWRIYIVGFIQAGIIILKWKIDHDCACT